MDSEVVKIEAGNVISISDDFLGYIDISKNSDVCFCFDKNCCFVFKPTL